MSRRYGRHGNASSKRSPGTRTRTRRCAPQLRRRRSARSKRTKKHRCRRRFGRCGPCTRAPIACAPSTCGGTSWTAMPSSTWTRRSRSTTCSPRPLTTASTEHMGTHLGLCVAPGHLPRRPDGIHVRALRGRRWPRRLVGRPHPHGGQTPHAGPLLAPHRRPHVTAQAVHRSVRRRTREAERTTHNARRRACDARRTNGRGPRRRSATPTRRRACAGQRARADDGAWAAHRTCRDAATHSLERLGQRGCVVSSYVISHDL